MIKCPECGAENLLGAIFCRGCGEKLDIDNLKPDQMQDKGKKVAKKTAAVVRNLIVLILLLIVGGLVVGLLIPPGYDKPAALDEEAEAKAKSSYRAIAEKASGSETFNHDELNYFAELIAGLTEDDIVERAQAAAEADESTWLIPQAMYVQLLPPDRARFVLKSEAFGFLPVHLSVSGPLTIDEDGGLTFEPATRTIGRIPMYGGYLIDQVDGQYQPLLQGNDQVTKMENRILAGVNEYDMSTDQVTLTK